MVAEALRSGWITTGPKTKEFKRSFGASGLRIMAKWYASMIDWEGIFVEE
jgi:hypothetical protein